MKLKAKIYRMLREEFSKNQPVLKLVEEGYHATQESDHATFVVMAISALSVQAISIGDNLSRCELLNAINDITSIFLIAIGDGN